MTLGLCLTIWKNRKKPKVSSCAIPIDLVVAVRIVELELRADSESSRKFYSDAKSPAGVIRAEGLVCVLDCETSSNLAEQVDGVTVQLSEASMAAVAKAGSLDGWHAGVPEAVPEPMESAPAEEGRSIPRKRKFHARRFLKAPAEKAAVPVKQKAPKKKALKPPKKVSPPDEEIQAIPANFRRNASGRNMIKVMMEKLLAMDNELFASKPMFSAGDQICRLKNIPSTVGVPWKEVKNRAPAYFEAHFWKARSPELYGNLVYREFEQILGQMQGSPCKRDRLILLIKSICEDTQKSLT